MTSSMTAFAREQLEHDWGTLICEIRSVNHRYLEPGFRLPDSLRHLEGTLRDLLRNKLQRGKVEVQIKWLASSGNTGKLHVNISTLAELRQATDTIAKHFDACSAVDPLDVLRWPGVVAEAEQDTKAIDERTLNLFRSTLDLLQAQREREGQQLRALIEDRLTQISAIVDGIRQDLPTILKAQAERIRSQFEELKLQVEATRLEQEIVLVTQKADIHEEVDRLDTHVKEVRHTLAQEGPVGRRLDFLMQELNREANTICSKAIVTSTTFGAVELKVLIEQMREQIQNIE